MKVWFVERKVNGLWNPLSSTVSSTKSGAGIRLKEIRKTTSNIDLRLREYIRVEQGGDADVG